ncbi:hypothetical protein DVE94_17665 [Salmonella enterica subsp. enterica serovar Newport]|nr:hypothetical protein [Salmonella enterica subsp. enterica serovar Newport]
MKMIRLSWDRAVNPLYNNVDVSSDGAQGMYALMKGSTHDIPVFIYYDAGQVISDLIDNTGIDIYPSLKHATRFNYLIAIFGFDSLHGLESGQYKLAMLADVVVA